MVVLQASFGDRETAKPSNDDAASKENEKPAEEAKVKSQSTGWGDSFLKQNKAAGESADAAVKAFLENPNMSAKSSEPAKESEASKPAVQAGGWGNMFLKQNKAASQTTDVATKSFLGNPSQPAASLAAGEIHSDDFVK